MKRFCSVIGSLGIGVVAFWFIKSLGDNIVSTIYGVLSRNVENYAPAPYGMLLACYVAFGFTAAVMTFVLIRSVWNLSRN